MTLNYLRVVVSFAVVHRTLYVYSADTRYGYPACQPILWSRRALNVKDEPTYRAGANRVTFDDTCNKLCTANYYCVINIVIAAIYHFYESYLNYLLLCLKEYL